MLCIVMCVGGATSDYTRKQQTHSLASVVSLKELQNAPYKAGKLSFHQVEVFYLSHQEVEILQLECVFVVAGV